MISIVIPTLNAAGHLPETLAALDAGRRSGLIGEVIVADGGSADDTVALAQGHGARVLTATVGRGAQLGEGAAAARGPWLLFLHADTRLEAGWEEAVRVWIGRPEAASAAAVFRFALDDRRPFTRWLEGVVAVRVRLLGLAYGDQGLLIHRRLYDEIGGYKPLPLMEDVDLVRRIGRRRITTLTAHAVTSAERYHKEGYVWRALRNNACLALYLAGLPARLIARIYG